MVRPLLCTRCGSPVGVAEDFVGHADWGTAVIDDNGTVRPARQHVDIYRDEPVRTRAVCGNDDCGHEWTLRRRFEPEALK
jgi:hypothetical protein